MKILELFSVGRPVKPRGVAANERINALSDGVFAIVFTLLVLELKVPELHAGETLGTKLREMAPEILSHVISFVVLGIYWVGHHNMFMHIKRHDRVLLWLNVLFLMLVASMPFPTGLVIAYVDLVLPQVIFFGTLVATGLVLDAIWWYASHDHHLVDADIDPELVSFVHRRVLMAPLIYMIAIGVTFASVLGAKMIFVVVAVLYIVPNPLDHFHHRQLTDEETPEQASAQDQEED